MPIVSTREDDIEILRLEHGKVSAIDLAFVAALMEALDAAERGSARALVLTGTGKVFSAGLDLRWTAAQDREAMGRFVDAFEGMFERLYAFPKPVVAAVNGAAFAGGAILALACDARVFAPGVAFAINEVLLGIPLPAAAFEVTRQALPRVAWEEMLLAGTTVKSERLVELGFGPLSTPTELVADAVSTARRFAAADGAAVAAVKADLCAATRERIARDREGRRTRFLDAWFGPPARARIAARLK